MALQNVLSIPYQMGAGRLDAMNPVNRQHPITRGMFGWWHSLGDSLHPINLINGVQATVGDGSPEIGQPGPTKLMNGMLFDGLTDRIACNHGWKGYAQGISCFGWAFNEDDDGSGADFIFAHVDGPGGDGWAHGYYQSGSKQHTTVRFVADHFSDVSFLHTVGKWYHWGFTFDNINNIARYWINGIQISTDMTTLTAVNEHNDWETNIMSIGARTDGTTASKFWPGAIADVGVWNRGLRNSEVVQLYQESLLDYPNMLNRQNRTLFVGRKAPAAKTKGMILLPNYG